MSYFHGLSNANRYLNSLNIEWLFMPMVEIYDSSTDT